jgi:hypothetical protein
MTAFPAIQPTARSFAPGQVPVTSFTSLSGKETRVILGDTASNHRLSLAFENIQEATGKQFIDHWNGQLGIALPFSLPAAVYAGWSLYQSAVPTTQQWRYESIPTVEFVAPGIMSVIVELVALS